MNAEIDLRVGDETDFMRQMAGWNGHDRQTALHYWKLAKRRKHLMVICARALREAMIWIIPPEQFDLQTRKLNNKYMQIGQLWVTMPKNSIFVFGPDEYVKPFRQADLDAALPKIEGGENGSPIPNPATKPNPGRKPKPRSTNLLPNASPSRKARGRNGRGAKNN